jgi:hypothetical protein
MGRIKGMASVVEDYVDRGSSAIVLFLGLLPVGERQVDRFNVVALGGWDELAKCTHRQDTPCARDLRLVGFNIRAGNLPMGSRSKLELT